MRICAAARYVGTLVLVLATIACGGTPTEPDPIYELKTKTFTGTIGPKGSAAFHFEVVNPGLIGISITAMSPAVTLPMGLDLGFWEPTTETCVAELSTPEAILNVVYNGNPPAPGEYCVGIFDIEALQGPTEFTLRVTHY